MDHHGRIFGLLDCISYKQLSKISINRANKKKVTERKFWVLMTKVTEETSHFIGLLLCNNNEFTYYNEILITAHPQSVMVAPYISFVTSNIGNKF
jgi:hypothetical protein